MKKTWVIVFTFILTGISLLSSESDFAVRIWFSHIDSENQVMADIASEFTLETGISVEVVSRRSIFDAPRDLANYAEAYDRPDIVLMQAPDIGNMVKSGFILPVEIDSDLRERFVSVAFEAFKYDGEYYGVGYSVDTSGLVYNKQLIREEDIPKTWEDFFLVAEELTVRDSSGKIVQYGTLINPKDMWFNYPIIKEYGGYYFGVLPDGSCNPYDVGLDNEGMLAYVEKIKDLQSKGLTLTNPNATESHISAEFANGRVAMILYGLWNASIYKSMGIDYGISPLPVGKNGKVSKPLATVQGFVINRFTNDLDATKSFLEFILKDENQQRLIEAGNRGDRKTGERNPTNISVINSKYIQKDTVLSSLSNIGYDCEPFPNVPEGPIWYNYTSTALRAIFYGDTSGNEVDAQEKLIELADRIRADVALINEIPEKIDIQASHVLIFAATLAGFIAAMVLLRRATKRNISQISPLDRTEKLGTKNTMIAWAMLLPLVLLLLVFYVFPIFHNIYLSLTNYSGVNLRDYGIVGLTNYREIFTSGIGGLVSMLIWTVTFAFMVVTISFIVGTALAVTLDKVGITVAKVYKMIFILPWVVPSVITLLMWRGMLEDQGLVNQILSLFGINSVPWLSHSLAARASSIIVMSWFSFPYFMVISSGILKSIPKDYFEVARIAGAGRLYIFFKITIPLIIRAIFPMLVMSFIMQFNQFGVYLLTQGGPPGSRLGSPGATDLLITYVFNTAFNTKRYSLAAAYSVIAFCFVAVFAVVSLRIANRKSY